MESIVDEVRRLSEEGIKEVTLLGQNVNSYSDESDIVHQGEEQKRAEDRLLSRGFKTVYKTRAHGLKFVDLLDKVSAVDPEMRVRFTSPHPKDFPDELLVLMKERPNICKQIHLPVQSGSSAVLERMRRGYTREAYLGLVKHIRSLIPQVSLSSDFIVGFCGETEADHHDTLNLVSSVGYDMAYMFAYSMREKTLAHRRYQDDVPEEVKQKRLRELIDLFYSIQATRVQADVGTEQLVLVEGPSRKSESDLSGKADGGRNIVFRRELLLDPKSNITRFPLPGDYVIVRIESCKGSTPIGRCLAFSSIKEFSLRGSCS